MFLAPVGGYQPTFQISHRINDPDWTGQEKHKFFIKSQDGQHYVNPNGSPNLESDPDKTTNVQ